MNPTGLAYGFQVCFTTQNLLAVAIGVLGGTVVGVLPGIGPVGSMAILLPFTLTLSPTAALIMLAGIYYGAMYGGSTTSILLNVPGEAASVITCREGYEMAKEGSSRCSPCRLCSRILHCGYPGGRPVDVIRSNTGQCRTQFRTS